MTFHGRHEWTEDHDALVRRWVAGEIPSTEVAVFVGVSPRAVRARAQKLGLIAKPEPVLRPPVVYSEKPRPGDPWLPIAHGNSGHWRVYDGSPVTPAEARDMVKAGIAVTAQRKVDGGYDLLFKVTA